MLEIINKKEYDKRCRDVIYELQTSEERRTSLTFSKDKVIKSIMSLEKKMFMPQHIPKGTKEDPDNPDFKEFTQAEKDACWCPNCRYPIEYWGKKEISYLLNRLRNLEEMYKTPI
jgi:hypothetical protein